MSAVALGVAWIFIPVLTTAITANVFAQSLSGGKGSNGINGGNNATSGGSSSTGTGGNGSVGSSSGTYGNGGGGGGAGVTGGSGGTGGNGRNGISGGAGGLGGLSAGLSGSNGASVYTYAGGGGGGGGAAGIVIISTSGNSTILSGGSGGAGGASNWSGASPDPGGGGGGGAGGYGAIVDTSGVTFTNASTISGGVGGNGGGGYLGGGQGGAGGIGVYLGSGSNLVNSGVITGGNGGAGGVWTSGTGRGDAGLSAPGVYVASGSTSTITNTGTITGGSGVGSIKNAGTITTLNNQQGNSASNPLTYTGALPTTYNIIIASSTNYGQLSITNATGQMVFGIYSPSTTNNSIVGQTLTGVLRGFLDPLSNWVTGLTQVGNTAAYTYSSANYSYSLTEQGSTGIWNLIVTACSICTTSSGGGSSGSTTTTTSTPTTTTSTPTTTTSTPTTTNITTGSTVTVTSLGTTYNPVLAGGTLVLSNGNSTSVPITLTSAGGTIQSPSSGSATLSGALTGSGALTFTGTGTTVLTGNNTYSGGTTVSGGTLSVAGTAPTGTGDVVIASAAAIIGTGTIAGNVTVAGTFKPGNSPGYLSVAQNVTLSSGGIYQQDIAGMTQASAATPVGATGSYSFLSVGGQMIINAGATLTPRLSNLFTASESGYGSSIYVPVLGDMFRIATASGGISGRFTALTQPAELSSGTQLIAFYNFNNSNSLDLATVPTSYGTTLASNTTNAKAVAGVLDQLLGVNTAGTSTATQDKLMYAVASQSAASLPTFAQSLAGEIHAASAATLAQTTQRLQQSVLARLGDYPMTPSQINPALNNALLTGGISATNPSGLPTANMSTNPAINPNTANVTSAAVADGRAWGEIAYQRTERANNSAGNGFNSNLYQIVTGVDVYSNAELGLKLGGGIALSNTTVSATGGNSTIQQGSLFVYGKMSVLQDYVLDGMASVGLSSTNLSRNDPTGYTGGFSSKAVMGNDVMVSVGLSRGFEYNDVRIAPYARVTYQYVGQNSYDEGSGVAALNIARFSGNAVQGVIGVAAGSLNKDPLKDDYTYRANVAVGADTSGLLNPTLSTTLGGYSSSVTTATAGSAFVQVGLYGTVKIADNAYAYAGVSGEARSGQTLYGGSVGLRMAF